MGIIFASGFLYLYLLYVQKPLSTSLGDEKDKKGMQGRVKLPCMGYMRLLASRCVMRRFVVIPVVTVSYCLFCGILGLHVNVSMPLQLFSIISPSAWCLSIVTNGHASSDWLPGPMLVGVHLGVICIVIGSSLMFLVLFVYVFDKEKLFISVLSQQNRPSGPTLSVELPPPRETSVGFPWRPVPEHLENLLGIREPLTVGDPPLSQTGDRKSVV